MADKQSLDEMIDAVALLPPGPDAWEPIFRAYPELTPQEVAARFRQRSEWLRAAAEELRQYSNLPPGKEGEP